MATIVILYLFLYYDNKPITEENLALSMSFTQNITKIESAKITLDFIKERMEFKSKFYPEGNGIKLESGSRGFGDEDQCSDSLSIQLGNGSGYSRTWHDDVSFPLQEYGDVDHILLTKTCEFSRKIVPNGEFTVHLYGEGKKEGAKIDDLQFETIFDSKRYDCRNDCVVAKGFEYSDSVDTERNEITATLNTTHYGIQRTEFDLRADDIELQRLTNILFTLLPVGIASIISTLIHHKSTKQQKLMHQIIMESHEEKQRRKEHVLLALRIEVNEIIHQLQRMESLLSSKDSDDGEIIGCLQNANRAGYRIGAIRSFPDIEPSLSMSLKKKCDFLELYSSTYNVRKTLGPKRVGLLGTFEKSFMEISNNFKNQQI